MADSIIMNPENLPMIVLSRQLMLETSTQKVALINSSRVQPKIVFNPNAAKLNSFYQSKNLHSSRKSYDFINNNTKANIKDAMIVKYSPMKIQGNRVLPKIIIKKKFYEQKILENSRKHSSAKKIRLDINPQIGVTHIKYIPQKSQSSKISKNVSREINANDQICSPKYQISHCLSNRNLEHTKEPMQLQLNKLLLMKSANKLQIGDYFKINGNSSKSESGHFKAPSVTDLKKVPKCGIILNSPIIEQLIIEGKKKTKKINFNSNVKILSKTKGNIINVLSQNNSNSQENTKKKIILKITERKQSNYEKLEDISNTDLSPWGTYD